MNRSVRKTVYSQIPLFLRIIPALLFAVGSSNVHGQTSHWQGVHSSDWRSADDWSKGVPDSGTKALVSVGGPSHFDLVVPSPTPTDTASSGDLTLQNGGRILFQEGENAGALNVHGSALVLNGGELSVGNGWIVFRQGLKVNHGGVVTSAAGTIIFAGDMKAHPGSVFESGSGTVVAEEGTRVLSGDVTFNDLDVETGDTLSLQGSFVVKGSLVIGLGSTVLVEEGSMLQVDGSVSGEGLLIDLNSLPVELEEFTASRVGEDVLLSWSTSTEVNNYGFVVQRNLIVGAEPVQWVDVGFVEGAGTSTSLKRYAYLDRSPFPVNGSGTSRLSYRLVQVDRDGSSQPSHSVILDASLRDAEISVHNYPNPFNPRTTIAFDLAGAASVTLKVYDAIGREVATLVDGILPGGKHQAIWDAADASSGVYYYVLETSFTQTGARTTDTRRMMLLR